MINKLKDRIRFNTDKLNKETGNYKNQQILKLKIEIDKMKIRILKLK